MSEFFEAIWHGEGVGDGGDLEEALQAYVAVKPEEGDWVEACAAEGADPVTSASPRLTPTSTMLIRLSALPSPRR